MNTLHDLSEALLMHPWRTAFVLVACGVIGWLFSSIDNTNPAFSAAPLFASYCLGVHIRIRLGLDE